MRYFIPTAEKKEMGGWDWSHAWFELWVDWRILVSVWMGLRTLFVNISMYIVLVGVLQYVWPYAHFVVPYMCIIKDFGFKKPQERPSAGCSGRMRFPGLLPRPVQARNREVQP